MSDPFSTLAVGLSDVASHAALVTPNDSADLAVTPRALLVGTAGTLKVTTAGGETLILPQSVVENVVIGLRVTRVHATDTTATDIVALW